MKGNNKVIRALLVVCFLGSQLGFFSGCRTAEDERRDRMAKADKYFAMIKDRPVPENKVFELQECIDTALKNNLDLRVYELTEKIHEERITSAYLEMLPDIYATYSLTSRNNDPGATSISLQTGKESLEPSRSTEKTVGVVKVELAFSLIDFGLSYLKALQADDKSRLTSFQHRRAGQNLTFDVARSYYRVAAAQHAMENTEKLLKLSQIIEKNLDYIAQSKTLSPLRTLAEKKQILKLKQSLEEYKRVYENSCIELKTLMGYAPWNRIKVDTACFDKFIRIELPSVDILEQVAIRKRPELFQVDTQTHLSVLEARKAILMMFPNVRMFLDFTHSSNSLLYHMSWWEIGIRCAYHLLRLPQQIKEWRALDMGIDEMEARTLALTSGILAQVRIAHANLQEVESRYKLTEQIYQTHLKQLRAAKEDAKAGGRISQIELFKMAMETANSSIERSQQLGNYYLAYYRLLNAVGLESLDDILKAEEILAELKKEQQQYEVEEDLFIDDPDYTEEVIEEEDVIEKDGAPPETSLLETIKPSIVPPTAMPSTTQPQQNDFFKTFEAISFKAPNRLQQKPLGNAREERAETRELDDGQLEEDLVDPAETERLRTKSTLSGRAAKNGQYSEFIETLPDPDAEDLDRHSTTPHDKLQSSLSPDPAKEISQERETDFSFCENLRLKLRDVNKFVRKTQKTLADVKVSVVEYIKE